MRFVLTVFFLIFFGKAMAEPVISSPEEIIKKSIEARGGREMLQRFEMVHLIGEGTHFKGDEKFNVEIERWNAMPLRQKTIFSTKENGVLNTTIVVFDKDQAWIKHNEQPAKAVLNGDFVQLKSQTESSQYSLLFPLLANKEIKLTMSPQQNVEDESCLCVLVQCKGKPDTTLSFSKKTFLLKKESYSIQSEDGVKKMEGIYSDYRKVEEGLAAFKQETFENSRISSSFILKKVIALKNLDEKFFSKPE